MRHKGLLTFLWIVALLGALAGGGILALGWNSADSAPQAAAVCALAIALAVIPYCLARATQEINRLSDEPDIAVLESIAENAERQTALLQLMANAPDDPATPRTDA